MPQDVHLDDINGDNNLTEPFCSSKLLFTFLRSGIVDFMYHGEVAVPTQDLSRFLTVAEQFQVRGLVEDVPKVGQRKYLCRPKNICSPLAGRGAGVEQQVPEQEAAAAAGGGRAECGDSGPGEL